MVRRRFHPPQSMMPGEVLTSFNRRREAKSAIFLVLGLLGASGKDQSATSHNQTRVLALGVGR